VFTRDRRPIVHGADLEDDRYGAAEARGLDAVLRGLSLRHGDDELIELAAPVFDGLHALFGSE
jgi:hypothetical protein